MTAPGVTGKSACRALSGEQDSPVYRAERHGRCVTSYSVPSFSFQLPASSILSTVVTARSPVTTYSPGGSGAGRSMIKPCSSSHQSRASNVQPASALPDFARRGDPASRTPRGPGSLRQSPQSCAPPPDDAEPSPRAAMNCSGETRSNCAAASAGSAETSAAGSADANATAKRRRFAECSNAPQRPHESSTTTALSAIRTARRVLISCARLT
mmetsp:Transcript_3622/g.11003  ORF Transcript_3622/g.11003 Transcript_3622/m.11003 type:complete len:212 (-) Transcript_3622:122-757(-)